MCGSSGKTTVVKRPADTTVDTSQPQFTSGHERSQKLYRLNNKKTTIEGDLNPSQGVVLGA